MVPVRDTRIAPVEDNLLAFLGVMATVPLFENDEHGDVTTYRSGLPHPLFNGVVGGRFASGTEVERSRDVMAPFVDAGLPFLWWSTPSTWSPGTHRALEEAGAVREDSPGMHVDLTGPHAHRPAGRRPRAHRRQARGPGHGRPAHVRGLRVPARARGRPSAGCSRASTPEQLVHVLATLDGEPVGCGSLWITGETAGLYNIAVLDEARQRGVGYALTSFLLDEARARGCTESVLHATRLGRPVYERLGYVEVCRLPQYVWVPSDS